MIPSGETVSGRKRREENEGSLARRERLRAYAERRRLRRQNLPPRLSYKEDPDGWHLTIPASKRITAALVRSLLLAAILSASWTLAFLRPDYEGWILGVVFAPFPAFYLFDSYRVARYRYRQSLVTFHVARDARFVIQGWRPGLLLHRGTSAEAAVGFGYSDDDALAFIVLPGGTFRFAFGERDLAVLSAFAKASGVRVTSEPTKKGSTDPREADAGAFADYEAKKRWLIGGAILFAGVAAMVLWPRPPTRFEREEAELLARPRSLTGSFHSTNDGLGRWTLSPSACLGGFERGFFGIAFLFPAGSPVEEIRLDATEKEDQVIEIHPSDRKGTVTRFRQRECDAIEADLDQTYVTVGGRRMLHEKGSAHFSCPKLGISGDATFEGCLPQ